MSTMSAESDHKSKNTSLIYQSGTEAVCSDVTHLKSEKHAYVSPLLREQNLFLSNDFSKLHLAGSVACVDQTKVTSKPPPFSKCSSQNMAHINLLSSPTSLLPSVPNLCSAVSNFAECKGSLLPQMNFLSNSVSASVTAFCTFSSLPADSSSMKWITVSSPSISNYSSLTSFSYVSPSVGAAPLPVTNTVHTVASHNHLTPSPCMTASPFVPSPKQESLVLNPMSSMTSSNIFGKKPPSSDCPSTIMGPALAYPRPPPHHIESITPLTGPSMTFSNPRQLISTDRSPTYDAPTDKAPLLIHNKQFHANPQLQHAITSQPIPSYNLSNGTVDSIVSSNYMQEKHSVQASQGPALNYHTSYRYPQSGTHSNIQEARALSVIHHGYNKLWNNELLELLQTRNIIMVGSNSPPSIVLSSNYPVCDPRVFRSTLTKIPVDASLLQRARLPLGLLIHPFMNLLEIPIIHCSSIVRCRSCRSYINPYVSFVEQKRWKLPDDFLFNPENATYGDPYQRFEMKYSSVEFIAPSEYMLRPPQPACYLFLLDVCYNAVETGYLEIFCKELSSAIKNHLIPGDRRTLVGIITFDDRLHFYQIAENFCTAQMMIVSDIADIFVPHYGNLLVNLEECEQQILDLLSKIPSMFSNTHATQSAVGAALQASCILMGPIGGRVTVVLTSLANIGPGALTFRDNPNARDTVDVKNLNPSTDFYKKIALDCSNQQIAVDMFVLASQHVDLASLSVASKFSAGCVYYYPTFHVTRNPFETERFRRDLQRYLTRSIGFEAVMRVRCTKSTDLLTLPNINEDSGFGMQLTLEDSLSDLSACCFQAALLYTSSKGERRIRVHTLCVPVTGDINAVFSGADQQCIIGLMAKMAVDRSLSESILDARDAYVNAAIDCLSAFKSTQLSISGNSGIWTCSSLRLIPLYILALLKSIELPELENPVSLSLRTFIRKICSNRPSVPVLRVVRSDSPLKDQVMHLLVDDRINGHSISYMEFLQKLKSQMN